MNDATHGVFKRLKGNGSKWKRIKAIYERYREHNQRKAAVLTLVDEFRFHPHTCGPIDYNEQWPDMEQLMTMLDAEFVSS